MPPKTISYGFLYVGIPTHGSFPRTCRTIWLRHNALPLLPQAAEFVPGRAALEPTGREQNSKFAMGTQSPGGATSGFPYEYVEIKPPGYGPQALVLVSGQAILALALGVLTFQEAGLVA